MNNRKIFLLCFVSALALLFAAEANAQCSVEYVGQDTITGGDWDGVTNPSNPLGSPIGVYGSYAHILPGVCEYFVENPLGPFEVPLGEYDPGDLLDFPFLWTQEQVDGLPCYAPDPPYNDEYESLSPPVTYLVRGTVVGPTGEDPPFDYIQHPVFTWGWDYWHSTQTAFREVYYRFLGGSDHWLMACWDDGGERCFPEHGYMDFELYFPEGIYLLSLYAYDKEADGSRISQEYQIWNQAMTMQVVPSEQISGTEYTGSIYKIYRIEAGKGGCTIIVRVINDAGHPPQVNICLSGIFVDKLNTAPGHTIGFWGNNIAKNLTNKPNGIQVPKADILEYLDLIDDTFCGVFCESWLCFTGTDVAKLQAALAIIEGHNNKATMQAKAKAAILTLLLSAAYYSDGDPDYMDSPIYLPDVGQGDSFLGTMEGAIPYILDVYCDGEYDAAHSLAQMLNNA
jgi:hypothetical protein